MRRTLPLIIHTLIREILQMRRRWIPAKDSLVGKGVIGYELILWAGAVDLSVNDQTSAEEYPQERCASGNISFKPTINPPPRNSCDEARPAERQRSPHEAS